MLFNVFFIVFFFKQDITHIHIHTYIHIHTQCTDVEQKKEKTFLFEIFSYFELLKRKKYRSIDRGKKKISPAKKRLVE